MAIAHIGELAALATAFSWTVAILCFETAGRRMGSLTLNMVRLVLGFVFLSLFQWASRGKALPLDADAHNWIWLSVSGLIGLTLGDLFLFRALVVVGSRVSMLIMSFVPVMSAVIGFFFLEETLNGVQMAGMAITVAGICIVVAQRSDGPSTGARYPLSGVLLAFGGAAGQAIGLVFSKFGMGGYDAFAANQIRILAAIAGFAVLFFFMSWWPKVGQALVRAKGLAHATAGSVFGPFLGVSLSLYAVQHTQVGVAATILAMVPIFIIPPAVVFKKERLRPADILGAVTAVGGSMLLFF